MRLVSVLMSYFVLFSVVFTIHATYGVHGGQKTHTITYYSPTLLVELSLEWRLKIG